MGRKKESNPELDKRIYDMYLGQQMSLRDISTALGIHYEIIRRKLKESGASIRSRSESMYNYWQNKKK